MTEEQKALREAVARAMKDAHIHDDEGPMLRLFDLLGFSGENKANMVVNALADAAIAVALERAAQVADAASFQWSYTASSVEVVDVRRTIAKDIRALIPASGDATS